MFNKPAYYELDPFLAKELFKSQNFESKWIFQNSFDRGS